MEEGLEDSRRYGRNISKGIDGKAQACSGNQNPNSTRLLALQDIY